jgi:hypothetical protein
VTAGLVTLNIAFEVTIKLNNTSGVNRQVPSQSFQLATSWRSKKFVFQSISDFGISDKGYRAVFDFSVKMPLQHKTLKTRKRGFVLTAKLLIKTSLM